MIERINRALLLPDVHMGTRPPKPYLTAKRFAKKYKPDEIILPGDFMSVDALSSYDLCKRGLIEGKRFKKEIRVAQQELKDLKSICPIITYIEGNHEYRVPRYLDDHPELKGMLELYEQLGLGKLDISWVKYGKEIRRSKLYIAHGEFYNIMFAKKTALAYGSCIAVTHTHRFQVFTWFPKKQKYPFVCYGLGTLGDTDPSYNKGKPTGHLNQFATLEYNKAQFNLYPINIINNRFIYNGKEWK